MKLFYKELQIIVIFHLNCNYQNKLIVCNPGYASRILEDDKDRGVTAFMPLGIGVYEDKKGQVFVSQLNIGLLGKMFGGTISEVMGVAGKDLGEVINSVTSV